MGAVNSVFVLALFPLVTRPESLAFLTSENILSDVHHLEGALTTFWWPNRLGFQGG